MSILSKETELKLIHGVHAEAKNYYQIKEKIKPKIFGLVTPKELKEDLDVNAKTLRRWERAGLKRYTPPIEDNRKIFYKIDDVLLFLGVEKGGKRV